MKIHTRLVAISLFVAFIAATPMRAQTPALDAKQLIDVHSVSIIAGSEVDSTYAAPYFLNHSNRRFHPFSACSFRYEGR